MKRDDHTIGDGVSTKGRKIKNSPEIGQYQANLEMEIRQWYYEARLILVAL